MTKLRSLRVFTALVALVLAVLTLAEPVEAACTPDNPCTIRVAFRYTEAAMAELARAKTVTAAAQACMSKRKNQGFCLFGAAVDEDIAEIAAAFERSGITQTKGKKKSILFLADKPSSPPGIDGGVAESQRADRPSAWRGGAGAFNSRIAGLLVADEAIKTFNGGSDINLFVLFTGFRDAKGGCPMNSVQTNGFIVLPACMIAEGVASPRHAMLQKLLFLHEAGHAFGAGHDDYADPGYEPCVGQAQVWVTDPKTKRSTLATKQFDRRPACAYRYPSNAAANARQAFCTIMGYYNPSGKYCAAHTAGLMGSGWVLEYSHTVPSVKCTTPGYEKFNCGDATHDNAKVMAANAADVARLRPGDPLPKGLR